MTAGLTVDVRIDAGDWPAAGLPALCEETAVAAVAAGAAALGPAEISVVLTDDAAMADLNRAWRGKDGPTNVLSFAAEDAPAAAGDGAPVLLGDVVVAFGTAAAEAAAADTPFEDHLRHLIVHGVLHLLGYDHEADDDAQRMEALETAILEAFGVADPYRDGKDFAA